MGPTSGCSFYLPLAGNSFFYMTLASAHKWVIWIVLCSRIVSDKSMTAASSLKLSFLESLHKKMEREIKSRMPAPVKSLKSSILDSTNSQLEQKLSGAMWLIQSNCGDFTEAFTSSLVLMVRKMACRYSQSLSLCQQLHQEKRERNRLH